MTLIIGKDSFFHLDDLKPGGVFRLYPGESVQVIELPPINYTDWYLCRRPLFPNYIVTREAQP